MTTESSKTNNLRHEIKHRISRSEDLVLSQRLAKLFKRDKYAGPDGDYRVTSLYFDTPYDSALREKLDGINRREKFRLRFYGTDTSFIRLEKKYKINGLCGKKSARITKEQVQKLLCGDIGFLLDTGDPLLAEFYSKIKGKGLGPKTIVSYDREAFLYEAGNVRITLDRNIRTGLGNTNFPDTGIFMMPADDGETVLEVKYDAFLPEIVRMSVQGAGRQAEACSKYAVCRRFD
ncbi:MAG TPA: polyphosphate polymerase domain-containing protein [Candidatus Alectryocaccobium stercorigallinarum]|nr:polyphosphate polymerase domain-containing protein [Candidatus Alectryocaccobium stercorigallinarum]